MIPIFKIPKDKKDGFNSFVTQDKKRAGDAYILDLMVVSYTGSLHAIEQARQTLDHWEADIKAGRCSDK